MKAALWSLVLAASILLGKAAAAEQVDLALVLAADVSRSIDEDEFKLQRKGYAAALTDPRVLQAIRSGPYRSIALTYVEWSGADEQTVVVDWAVVKDGETAAAFADALLAAPRPHYGRTSISAAVDFSVQRLARSGVEGSRRVIDVSGDGTNNSGRAVTEARDDALSKGVTINGLAIINEHPVNSYVFNHVQPPEGLPEWYRRNVIGGPGAFLMVVKDFHSFADGITQKLVSEIAGIALPAATASRSE
jgi:hypothetical protein